MLLQVLNIPPEAVDTVAMAAATSSMLNEELNKMGLTASATVTATAGPSSFSAIRWACSQCFQIQHAEQRCRSLDQLACPNPLDPS
jgi:hypothetical protein